MPSIAIKPKDEVRELRLRLKRYLDGFTFPPKQSDLAKKLKVSPTLLSNFLNRPETPITAKNFLKFERFLNGQNGA